MDLDEEFILQPNSHISLSLVHCDYIKEQYENEEING